LAEGRGNIAGQRVFDRDHVRFDDQRRDHVNSFDHFHHAIHVFGVIPQDEGLGAGQGDDALGHPGEGREHVGQVFDVGVFDLDDLGHHFAGFGQVVGIGGNKARPRPGLGLRDDFGEFVSNGDNGDAVHAEDRFQGFNGLRASQGAFGFEMMVASLGTAPGRLLERRRVRPTKSA
jgi:hypothetical protein